MPASASPEVLSPHKRKATDRVTENADLLLAAKKACEAAGKNLAAKKVSQWQNSQDYLLTGDL